MILKNPTQNEVSIGILGSNYSILPGKELEVLEDVGTAWLKIHEFLQVVETTPVEEAPTLVSPKSDKPKK